MKKKKNLTVKQKRMQIAKFNLDNYVYGHLHGWHCAMCGVEPGETEPANLFPVKWNKWKNKWIFAKSVANAMANVELCHARRL